MLDTQDLPLLGVFAAVARLGSFTAAAKELGLSKSVVSERVRTLEARCEVRLLERSTRRLRLTQVGEQVLSVAAVCLDATRDVARIIEEHRDAPVGTLRVTTTQDLASRLVGPIAARLAAKYPSLYLKIVADDAHHDLISEGFDVGVRLGAPRDSSYGLQRLATIHEIIAAAPSLAQAYARAARPKDLAGAPWVRHTLLPRADAFVFSGPRGEKERVGVTVRAEANTGDGMRGLVRGGVGFGAMAMHLAAGDLQTGALVRVCPEWRGMEISLYAVLPSSKRRPRRVALFLQALKAAIEVEHFLPGVGRA